MKRSDIKKRPLSDTVLENLESEDKDYRELDGNGLYFFVKANGTKSWQLRFKKPDGKWSWLGIGGYPSIKGKLARKKAQELLNDIGNGLNPIITKQDRKAKELEDNTATFEALAREWLTEKTGTRYYIESDKSGIEQSGNVFTIKQVHDVRSRKDLKAIIQCLERYGVTYGDIKVTRIEVSLDFYNARSKALLTALYKSLAYFENSINERIYKTGNVFTPIPKTPIDLLRKLEDGYCIGVNPDGSLAYHTSYHKMTDRGLNLPESEHRFRTEVNCAISELGVNNSLSNLPEIIQCAFDRLKFTRLSKSATGEDKKLYRKSVTMFGKRVKEHYSGSRHKRNFNQVIIKNGELNKAISRKVSDLKRNFKE